MKSDISTAKRVFFMIMDSFGIGAAPDAAAFGDEGADTLRAVSGSPRLFCPNLARLGLFDIAGTEETQPAFLDALSYECTGSYGRLRELSAGKDTIIGHWELAGLVSQKPMPVFPEGFPADFISAFERAVGHRCIVNRPYSGTRVIEEYGEQALKENALIVYTSADSVFQIAANESQIPVEELYRCCEIARDMLTGDLAVGRVIARPFEGTDRKSFRRTERRHDYALSPPAPTMLDVLRDAGKDVIGVGKIGDIFNGQGLTESHRTTGNLHGLVTTDRIAARNDWSGLCFVNLVDFDMLYGHRRDIDGYAQAVTDYDAWLSVFMDSLREDDLLIISADHGCDPSFLAHTDHTREYVPLLMYGCGVEKGRDLGTIDGFGFAAETILQALGTEGRTA